jgi:cyclophilin family peptidyl-prolyl cis-trans isomerase
MVHYSFAYSHLDGGYTIFGEVVAGMDVVHRLEVGDKILKIQLIN